MSAASEEDLKLGASRSLLGDDWHYPLHGLRHPPDAGTSGWYCWSGEYSDAEDFFVPIHQRHLSERIPELAKHLSMPPGSRFLLVPGHPDTWYDSSLLDV